MAAIPDVRQIDGSCQFLVKFIKLIFEIIDVFLRKSIGSKEVDFIYLFSNVRPFIT